MFTGWKFKTYRHDHLLFFHFSTWLEEKQVDSDAWRHRWWGDAGEAGRSYIHSSSQTNSLSLLAIWALRRMMMLECIWETRDSERSSVAPISFMVISS